MPMRRWKLSVVPVSGEEGNARSKTAKRGNVFSPCPSLGGAPKIDHYLPEPYTNHTPLMNQKHAMQCIVRTINFSQDRATVGGVSGISTVTELPSRKPYQSFAQGP